jgi:hypothetical protein
MRNHLSHLTIAIAISALGFASGACSGRTTAVNMTEERAKSAANENPNQRLELIGCVKAAETPGMGKFILDRVVPPPGALVPQASPNGGTALIPRGSWVRLAGVDMQPYLGKRVAISGDLVSPSPNAVGTMGQNGSPQDPPQIAVETVKVQADKCE